MKYLLANKEKALAAGYTAMAHRHSDTKMLLNEKEVIFDTTLAGDLTERASALEATIISHAEAIELVEKGGLR
jgi:hypothetical protein